MEWKDKVKRRATYAPYYSGGIKMVDYENMVKALRLNWLKTTADGSYNSYKCHFNDLLCGYGGLFLFVVITMFIMNFYCVGSELRDTVDCNSEYKYIVPNNSIFFRMLLPTS